MHKDMESYCRVCKKNLVIRRAYIRDKISDTPNHEPNKRSFKAIGWYCLNCGRFISHEQVEEEKKRSLVEMAKFFKQNKIKIK
jgi:ribosomal protein L44E